VITVIGVCYISLEHLQVDKNFTRAGLGGVEHLDLDRVIARRGVNACFVLLRDRHLSSYYSYALVGFSCCLYAGVDAVVDRNGGACFV
jgi:hypothetical protein